MHMHEELPHDDLLFDRLVDGELSPAERRQLLASLDDRPDGWRRCALRFLEAQCWTENLRQFVREPADDDSAIVSNALPTAISSTRESARRGVSWAAIAAGLLVAFTLGLVARNAVVPGDSAPIAADMPNPDASLAEVVPPPADVPNGARVDDALTLFVRDDSGRTRPLRVPLLDAEELDQQLGLQFRTGVPDFVRNGLQDRGFDVQSKRSYAPLWLEDGRPMFVPVEDTKIVPVRQNVY
jgi:hypothetical protein